MASKPVVFVIGASGNIGSATLTVLSVKYGDKLDITAGVRNPDKVKDKLPSGVKIVKATMGDKEGLKDTLRGVDALYIIAPPTENRAELVIQTAEAAKDAGVKFLLVVSVPTRSLTDTVFGRQLGKVETEVSKLGVPHSFLRLPMFMDNTWGYKSTIQSQSAFYGGTSKPLSTIAVEDAAKVGAVILSDYTKHENKSYDLASDRYTNAELASAFTEVLGKEIKYVQVPLEAVKKAVMEMGVPEWQANGLVELSKLIEEDAPALNIDTSVIKALTGDEPTKMKAWVAKYGEAFK